MANEDFNTVLEGQITQENAAQDDIKSKKDKLKKDAATAGAFAATAAAGVGATLGAQAIFDNNTGDYSGDALNDNMASAASTIGANTNHTTDLEEIDSETAVFVDELEIENIRLDELDVTPSTPVDVIESSVADQTMSDFGISPFRETIQEVNVNDNDEFLMGVVDIDDTNEDIDDILNRIFDNEENGDLATGADISPADLTFFDDSQDMALGYDDNNNDFESDILNDIIGA